MSEYEERLKLLGQIAVVRNRLDKLEAALIERPMGDAYLSEGIIDAIGNVSVQTGALVGQATQYRDVARR